MFDIYPIKMTWSQDTKSQGFIKHSGKEATHTHTQTHTVSNSSISYLITLEKFRL